MTFFISTMVHKPDVGGYRSRISLEFTNVQRKIDPVLSFCQSPELAFVRFDPIRSVVTVPYRAGQECLGVRRQRWFARLGH
jgi:hypothetical protein